MSKQDFEQFLTQSLNKKNTELQPDKDLWPGIERAITEDTIAPKSSKNNRWRKRAVVAACMVATILVAQQFIPTAPTNNMITMSRSFAKQKHSLLVQYQNKPALTDNWQQQLNELENAEHAIKRVLEKEPNNVALLNMLAQIYQQQLDLINKVHASRWQQI